MNKVYHTTPRFTVEPAKFTDPVLGEEVEGYGVFNTATGVREAECRREFTAIHLANGFQDQFDNPSKYVDVPEGNHWTDDFSGGEGVH